MGNRSRTPSIHMLDDDSLLHIFHLYRPFLLGEDEDNEDYGQRRLWGGDKRWVRGRWWYGLAHVCRRWRNIILGSASYLDLSLVCTYGTPVADMLTHSPHLPLVVDYSERGRDITTDDEEGIIFALKQRERVLRVRLYVPVTSLREFIAAMNDEYPILEFLVIQLPFEDMSTILTLPETLQAPHLRSLHLRGFAPLLCPSDRMSIAHDCCGPRHTQFLHDPPIHVLPTKYSTPMDFSHAPARDALNLLRILYSQSRCRETTHAHADHRTRHTP